MIDFRFKITIGAVGLTMFLLLLGSSAALLDDWIGHERSMAIANILLVCALPSLWVFFISVASYILSDMRRKP